MDEQMDRMRPLFAKYHGKLRVDDRCDPPRPPDVVRRVCPMPPDMAWTGALTCLTGRDRRASRKFHTITLIGQEGLALAQVRLRELKGQDKSE
jgi:hypothetical protein